MYIKLENIVKTYGDDLVFDHASLCIEKPGIYYIKGKSGSGKTTLFHLIAGFEMCEGTRYVNEDAKIAFIFQSYELLEEMTIKDNLQMVKDIYEVEENEWIKLLGIDHLMDHYPCELSGGERQRVGIARALLVSPSIILCDEPTVSLDQENRKIVLDLLTKLSKNCIVMISSHNEKEMLPYSNYVYEIEDHKIALVKKEEMTTTMKQYTHQVDWHIVKMYFHKMVKAQRNMMAISFFVFGILGLLLLQIDAYVFHQPLSTNVLNAEMLYITDYQEEKQDQYDRAILMFDPIEINDQYYRSNVYPYVQNEAFPSIKLEGNQVVINSVLASLLSDDLDRLQNEIVTLKYQLDGNLHQQEFIIQDVIQEDCDMAQLYYDYDYMMEVLKQTYHSSKYANQYEYFMDTALNYEKHYAKEEIEEQYQLLSSRDDKNVYHSIYTPNEKVQEQKAIYHMMYLVVEGIVALAGIIFVLYQEHKYATSMKYRLSIMTSLSLPLSTLKRIAFVQIIQPYLVISVLFVIEMIAYALLNQGVNLAMVATYLVMYILVSIGYVGCKLLTHNNKAVNRMLQNDKV